MPGGRGDGWVMGGRPSHCSAWGEGWGFLLTVPRREGGQASWCPPDEAAGGSPSLRADTDMQVPLPCLEQAPGKTGITHRVITGLGSISIQNSNPSLSWCQI